MQIEGVDFVALPAQDLDRAVRFYRDVLGLKASQEFAEKGMVEFDAGGMTVSLYDPTKLGQEFQPATAMVALRVADVEAAMQELEGKGVQFPKKSFDSGVCFAAMFQDPEGNTLTLHHRYAPRR
jgi:predicted enzyme related to lactoylglutathione lyase